MGLNIDSIKNLFAKKRQNHKNEDELNEFNQNEEEGDLFNNSDVIDESNDVIREEEDYSETPVNSSNKKKKFILIGSGIAIFASAAILGPSLISGLSSSYENDNIIEETQNIRNDTIKQNQTIENKETKLKDRSELDKVKNVNNNATNNVVENKEEQLKKEITTTNEIKNSKEELIIEKNIINTDKIAKTDLISGDNTEALLSKINTNSTEIQKVVDSNLQTNMNKKAKDLVKEIDPFLLESMVIVDNNYHKKVMLSQVETMKEFMKYLDIKKQFDDSIQLYKEGVVKRKSIEEKIVDELGKFNLDKKLLEINNSLNSLKDENDKLKYILNTKSEEIQKLTSSLTELQTKQSVLSNNSSNFDITNSGTTIKYETVIVDGKEIKKPIIVSSNLNTQTQEDKKLLELMDNIEIESLNVYTINNIPIAEIVYEGKTRVYKNGEIFNGFKIKDINKDGMLLSFKSSNGIEKTRFMNVSTDLSVEENFDVLKIKENGDTSTPVVIDGDDKGTASKNNAMNVKNNTNNNAQQSGQNDNSSRSVKLPSSNFDSFKNAINAK